MKINQRYIIALVIIIFLAAFVFLYMGNARQKRENTTAQENLNNANTAYATAIKEKSNQEDLLNQATGQIAQLQSRLIEIQLQLQEQQQVIPESIKNIDYDEILFNIADANKLQVLSLNIQGPTEVEVNGVTLFLYTFNISLSGDTPDILNYVNDVTTGDDFISAIVEGITMTVSTIEVPVDEETTIEVPITQGDITITVYGVGKE